MDFLISTLVFTATTSITSVAHPRPLPVLGIMWQFLMPSKDDSWQVLIIGHNYQRLLVGPVAIVGGKWAVHCYWGPFGQSPPMATRGRSVSPCRLP
ncbi:hypothetical protein Nepgr_015328 [Nepenthes gracilis]|uniref:Uncharacterized protein n=1 Tax=Nepenthes gracilis TaxID=150966 RepID=A0AAD3SN34_NEPGR|nr:hypothetical protein Nepgr_015328 [Nepenthes gracilis]